MSRNRSQFNGVKRPNEFWRYARHTEMPIGPIEPEPINQTWADAFSCWQKQGPEDERIRQLLIIQFVGDAELLAVFCEVNRSLRCVFKRHRPYNTPYGKSTQSPRQRSQGRFPGLYRYVAPRRIRSANANRGTITSGKKAEAYADCYPRFGFGPRFPRYGLETRFSHLAGHLLIGEPLSRNLRQNHVESVRIGDLVFSVSPIVVAEHLLIQIAEKMEWFN